MADRAAGPISPRAIAAAMRTGADMSLANIFPNTGTRSLAAGPSRPRHRTAASRVVSSRSLSSFVSAGRSSGFGPISRAHPPPRPGGRASCRRARARIADAAFVASPSIAAMAILARSTSPSRCLALASGSISLRTLLARGPASAERAKGRGARIGSRVRLGECNQPGEGLRWKGVEFPHCQGRGGADRLILFARCRHERIGHFLRSRVGRDYGRDDLLSSPHRQRCIGRQGQQRGQGGFRARSHCDECIHELVADRFIHFRGERLAERLGSGGSGCAKLFQHDRGT